MKNKDHSHLICMTVPSLSGGIGRNLVNLAKAFKASRFRVHILVEKSGDPALESALEADDFLSLPTTHPVSGVPTLAFYIWRQKPSVILTPVLRHTILALRSRRLSGHDCRIFANIHNTYSRLYADLPMGKSRSRYEKFSRYYPRCTGIIAVSKGVAEDFSAITGLSGDRIEVIHNPIVSDGLTRKAMENVSHPWFEAGQPPVILGAGRLVKAKNFPLLIRSFEAVRQKMQCRCVILGDGPLRSEIERQVQMSACAGDIDLIGHQANPFKFMKRAGVFVMSSSWEGFGNVLVEAMATGTPVVSTDCPSGPREILLDGKYGELVPVDDPAAMAEAIARTLLHKPEPGRLSEGIMRFETDTVARRYLNLFGLTG